MPPGQQVGQATAGWWDALIDPARPSTPTDGSCLSNVLALSGDDRAPSTAPDGSGIFTLARITIRDQVAASKWVLADALGTSASTAVMGGSMGGCGPWSGWCSIPNGSGGALVMATRRIRDGRQIATQNIQIAAIQADPDWLCAGDHYARHCTADRHGNRAQIAHLTYRTEREPPVGSAAITNSGGRPADGRFAAQSYLDHQADADLRFGPGDLRGTVRRNGPARW